MDIFNVLNLIGGLCLFLFGMNLMGQALERRAGGKLRSLLGKMTGRKLAGFATGLGITAVIQSSSATTVMVVGFVNSGLLTLRQAINVIMGANVGTTVTAWLLSLGGIQSDAVWVQLLKPSSFTPVLALIGIVLYMFCKSGKKKDTGGKVEMLLLTPKGNDVWEVLVNPGRKALPGMEIEFSDDCYCKVLDKTEFGGRLVEFHYNGNFDSLLDQIGEMPTPPYIHKKLDNNDEYQTVYAKYKGSAAAPTAGLHFTPELMEEMKKKGAELLFVTLHVGIGTFRPVSEENIEDHEMHKEWYTVSEETAEKINKAKEEGRRIIAVGTTSVRTLESAGQSRKLKSGSNWTQLYIYPGYQWKMVDAIVTNFHLPESTLIMMMASFAGREHILAAYEEAVRQKYRFFSFGDAMFIR